jgi:hypothetical protein
LNICSLKIPQIYTQKSPPQHHVGDLNKRPDFLQTELNVKDNSVDMMTMDLSVDYMVHPVELFSSIHKALKPETGIFVCSFSNRFFPLKVIQMWMKANCPERAKIVASYYHYSGFRKIQVIDLPPAEPKEGDEKGDPLTVMVGWK